MAYIGKRPVDTFPANNAVTASIISANAVGASEIAANSVTANELAQNSVLTQHIDDAQVTADQLASSAVTTAKINDDAVTLAKMAGLTRGSVIVGDASGDPSALALGSNGYVLKSDGTDIAWAADAGKTTEEIQDIAGAMFSSNTETGITATYQDADGTIDLAVGTLNQDTTGSAATLATGRTIGMTGDVVWTSASFDGSGNVTGTSTIQADAVEQSMIADDAVGADQLAANSVVSASIVNGTIVSADIAANTIATSNIADNAIDSTKIAQNSILTKHIDDAQVGTDQLADDAVTAAKLADTAVTAASYGSATAIPTFTVDAQGRLTAASTAAISSSLTVAADSGSNDTVTIGTDTLTFEGTANEIETTVSNNKINIGLPTNVTIAGNLTVAGTTTEVSSTTINVADPLVSLATSNNSSDAVDIGIYGLYDTSGSQDLYGGLFRDASDSGKWKLFKDNQAAPTTTVNTSGTGYAVGTLVANIEGNVTGNVTGNTSGTAATVTTAAQTNITSLGTLTALTVDNVVIDGAVIGHTGDTDLITLSSGVVTVAGEVDATSLDISGNADIDGTLEADAITVDGTALNEYIADTVGAMVGSNTESGITVAYEDSDNTLDFTVGTLNQNTTGTAASWTTARTLSFTGDVTGSGSVDGTANVATALTIASDSVEQSMIADDAVGADQLAANSVVSASIVNGSIVSADIAANTIATSNIADNAVDATKIASNSILTRHVDDNQITGDQLADDLVLSGTGAIRVPDGTTGQRPGSPAAGMFRYNTTDSKFEGYTDSWGEIGGGGSNTFLYDSMTGDGSDTTLALSQTPASEDMLMVFIDGVYQQKDAYTLSGSTLTFADAPVSGRKVVAYSVSNAVAGDGLNVDNFSGDGSDTTFTLSLNPTHENNTQVYIDGVYQFKNTYSVSGTTLTFSTAPPNGSSIEVMVHTQTTVNSAASLAAGAVSGLSEVTISGADHIMLFDATDNTLKKGLASDLIEQLTTEEVQDVVGGMVSSNTETGVAVTYEDGDGTLDFVLAAAQPTITSVGTLTSFRSTGIDDNADALAMTIDSSERVLIASSTAVTGHTTAKLQINGTDNAGSTISIGRFSANANAPTLQFIKSRNATVGGNTVVQDGDNLGEISFAASDGSDTVSLAAKIFGEVDGTPGSNDMPGRLTFFTTADGASSPTERMRIDSNGTVQIGSSSAYAAGAAVLHLHQPDATSNAYLHITQQDGGATSSDGMSIGVLDGGANASIRLRENGYMNFYTNNTERMRILADGTLCVGADSDVTNTTVGLSVYSSNAGGIGIGHGNGTNEYRRIYYSTGEAGYLYFDAAANTAKLTAAGAWTDASDKAYKKDIGNIAYGLDEVKAMQPRKYKVKADDSNAIGFIAQEIESIIPEVVNGEEGSKGIAYGQLTAVLVKAMQEQQTIIEALETRIKTLEDT